MNCHWCKTMNRTPVGEIRKYDFGLLNIPKSAPKEVKRYHWLCEKCIEAWEVGNGLRKKEDCKYLYTEGAGMHTEEAYKKLRADNYALRMQIKMLMEENKRHEVLIGNIYTLPM